MAKDKKKKKQKWIKFRHRIVWSLALCVLYPYTRIKYRVKIKKYKEKNHIFEKLPEQEERVLFV